MLRIRLLASGFLVFFLLAGQLIAMELAAKELPDSFIELQPGQVYQGQLYEEPLRFYFHLDKESDILLESHTPQRSNKIYPEAVLFTQAGRTIERDWSGGKGRNFKIERTLAAGIYVLRVENGRRCGSLHGCPETTHDFSLTFKVTESSPF